MTVQSIFTKSALAMAVAVPTFAMAGGLYGTAQLGYSAQIEDANPYGNNIAVDADFPSEFDTEDGFVVGLGLGYQVSDNFRVEGRFAHRHSEYNNTRLGTGARAGHQYLLDGELENRTFTLEGFYDVGTFAGMSPYVKAGVGVAQTKYSARLGGNYITSLSAADFGGTTLDAYDGKVDGYYDNYKDGDETNFAWNVGAGISAKVSDNATFFSEYQYVNTGDIKTAQDEATDGFKVDDASAHEVALGLRYQF